MSFPNRVFAVGGISGTSALNQNIRDVAMEAEKVNNPARFSDGQFRNFARFKIIVGTACNMSVNGGTPYPLAANTAEIIEDVSCSSLTLDKADITYTIGYQF